MIQPRYSGEWPNRIKMVYYPKTDYVEEYSFDGKLLLRYKLEEANTRWIRKEQDERVERFNR